MLSRTALYYRKSKKGRANRLKQQRALNSTEGEKKKRAARNAARAMLKKKGVVRKGDGKDVDHKDGNPHNNSKGNLRVMSKYKNRSKK